MPPGIGNGSETSPTESPAISGLTTEGKLDKFCHFTFPPTSLVGATEYLDAASENFLMELIFLKSLILLSASSSNPDCTGKIISVSRTWISGPVII